MLRVRRLAVLVVFVAAIAAAAWAGTGTGTGVAAADCPAQRPPPAYARSVVAALSAREDVWGNRLLAAPGGPTYAAARGFLRPLVLARTARGLPLTTSGVHYLAFGVPDGPRGATSVALHVADGGEIVSRRVGGPSLAIWVGEQGRERYGSCLARLGTPTLAEGWLPILETRYVDGNGSVYRQESFVARAGEKRSLVSFVRLTVAARRSGAVVRLAPSHGEPVVRRVRPSTTRTLYAGWQVAPARMLAIDEDAYAAARASVVSNWTSRLGEGMAVEVPERRVEDAARALLVQNLTLTWRYSSGNQYEQFSFPEGVDVAEVMGELGFEDVARAILRTSLTRPSTRYPNWKMGERLLASAAHFRLYRDRAYLRQATPTLRGYVAALGRQIDGSRRGILDRERFSSDIPDAVYGLHSQAVVWAGLRGMASAWRVTGEQRLAATCGRLAARLGAGLRRAVRESERPLPDGSLFVPVRLLDDEQPYGSVTEARAGSYWNLVMPYALASGLFPPGSREARGVRRYLELHGSRLLGLVRAGAYSLYGLEAPFPLSGTNSVYGINTARFLADAGEADRLVLSLYGQLATGMTPGTFVAGEAASVAPIAGQSYRAMYLPPNGAANAAFLETLRLMLVHETPDGLELAYATPRGWTAPGRRIAVRNAPTQFGPVSFSIAAGASSADVAVEVPRRSRPRTLRLRLRLPDGKRITAVSLAGSPYRRFDAATGTIDLSGRAGSVHFRVGFRRAVK
ncbi:MAG TPA: hypothetical protein VH721_09400 [Gaiellaceae bacterium]